LLKDSGWYSTWQMDFAYYSDLLHYAREAKIPVVGINVSKELRQKVGMHAPAELDEETRMQLPEMDFDDPYQKAMAASIFTGHGAGSNMFEAFLRVQTLWDESMAENIVRYMAGKGQEHRMVVIAGGYHVRHGFGIPRRVYRRMPTSYVLVGSTELVVPADLQDKFMDVVLPTFPMVPYDYLEYTEYEKLPGERVKLGVRMSEDDGKVVVEAVVPDSAAAIAGVEAGDIIVALDETPIEENFDLIYAVNQHVKGDRSKLTIDRGGERLELDVTFIPLPMTMKGHGQGK
jgi:membrane-associated protease RseP (regulator of RpoE activity)